MEPQKKLRKLLCPTKSCLTVNTENGRIHLEDRMLRMYSVGEFLIYFVVLLGTKALTDIISRTLLTLLRVKQKFYEKN